MEQPIRVLTPPERWFGPGLHAAVTERTGGVSPAPWASLNLGLHTADEPARVRENERRALRHLGIDRLARADLVHGAGLAEVETAGTVRGVDALLTRTGGPALGLTVADCFPLFLAGGAVRVLAHCGWRGVAGGLVEVAVARLHEAGAPPREQRAWIGPGIGPCCYEVGPEVAARFAPADRTVPRSGTHPRLDLGGAIVRRLLHAGLPLEAVAAAGVCTACHTSRFFSHRAEGTTGRMSAYFWSSISSA